LKQQLKQGSQKGNSAIFSFSLRTRRKTCILSRHPEFLQRKTGTFSFSK
jgi:hypothetical protein